jgi:hypothetical protein
MVSAARSRSAWDQSASSANRAPSASSLVTTRRVDSSGTMAGT